MKALYYGDNLQVLRDSISDVSVDLVYLDPPFNSNATYNVLFKSPTGQDSEAQIEAFEDTWHWNTQAELAFDEVMQSGRGDVAELLRAMRQFLGENDMMAYLAMMAVRLIELHRVLKHTGSLYLHCDPTASHYLKLLLDAVFGMQNFSSEIIWKRTSAHPDAKRYASVHDVLLFYKKSEEWIWNPQFETYTEDYVSTHFVHKDENGRVFRRVDLRSPSPRPNLTYDYKASNGITYKPHPNGWAVSREKMQELDRQGRLFFPRKIDGRLRRKLYLEDSPGVAISDNWTDIKPIFATGDERLGYPTQKPLALLERVIEASSNPGDVVLDPFCGCGTAVHAAEKLGRSWIGIDLTHLAISLIEKRLNDAFPKIEYEVHGTPKDIDGALALSKLDKYQFQWWAVSLVNAVPYGGKKKGADSGIDGFIYFKPDSKTTERAIVSVKGGENISVSMIRDLKGVLEREKAKLGIFITLTEPTKPMVTEAASAGFYECDQGKFARLQMFTVAELLKGAKPKLPLVDQSAAFKKAKKEDTTAKQPKLL